MSLLDDARRLLGDGHIGGDSCAHCGRYIGPGAEDRPLEGHDSDCSWLSMPKIVAALEALEEYVRELEDQGERINVLRRIQAYQNLVAALKGEA